MAVVGSGYIAAEFGGVLNALGSETSVFLRFDKMIRYFDPMLSDRLTEQMRAAGVEIVTGAVPSAVTGKPGDLTLHTADGRSFGGFETLIWAIGRTPSTAALGLADAGVEVDASRRGDRRRLSEHERRRSLRRG